MVNSRRLRSSSIELIASIQFYSNRSQIPAYLFVGVEQVKTLRYVEIMFISIGRLIFCIHLLEVELIITEARKIVG